LKKPTVKRNSTGAAIKRARMSITPKVTQEDMVGRLARQGLLLSQGQIAKIENGTRPVMDYELTAIAKALKVKVESFFAKP
jgi:HTH-type transcriptional regulator, cell division transcriptional repressor